MKGMLYALIIGTLFSCGKNETYPQVIKIGHGGMGLYGDYPMNSYESLTQALMMGADGVEMDVQMTRDSVLVLFHDLTLDHKTTGSGAIHDHTWEEIKNSTYDEVAFGRFELIRLDYFFAHSPSFLDKQFNFDVKPNGPNLEHIYTLNRTLSKLITAYNLTNNCIVEFQREDQIAHLISLRTDLKIYMYSDFESAKNTLPTYAIAGWVASKDVINTSKVDQIHQLNGNVVGFTTFNKKDHVNLIHMGVDIIETDDLNGLLKLYK